MKNNEFRNIMETDEELKKIEKKYIIQRIIKYIGIIGFVLSLITLIYILNDGGYDIFSIIPILGIAISIVMILCSSIIIIVYNKKIRKIFLEKYDYDLNNLSKEELNDVYENENNTNKF